MAENPYFLFVLIETCTLIEFKIDNTVKVLAWLNLILLYHDL